MHKSQSAMEYLMTYGWAILAIAVVMVSLYSLGIFNLGNLQPSATPGSCQIIKTAAQTNLAGQCNNLIPKYVGQFNGATSYITVADSKVQRSMTSITLVGWMNSPTTDVNSYDMIVAKYGLNITGYSLYLTGGALRCTLYNPTGGPVDHSAFSNIHDGKWHFVACTFDGSTMTLYEDGTNTASWSGTWPVAGAWATAPLGIGYRGGLNLNGYIADVQVYNASLDSSSIKALYREGIGGVPVDLQHIVAWYPLNGNGNDYSGFNNNANMSNIVNVIWNANWQTGYATPSS